MIKIGFSEKSITPDKKAYLEGQFFERISEYVETPVTVTAMAVESEGEQMIICSCDLVGMSASLSEEIKQKVAVKNIGIDKDKIIICVTHDHTSLSYDKKMLTHRTALSVLEEYLPENLKYIPLTAEKRDDVISPADAFDFLAERISEAIAEAWNRREISYIANAFGRAAVGMNRRVCYDDGSAKMWGDADSANFTELEGGNDSGIELMYVFDEQKNIKGIVANVACPSQVVEHRCFISADYWGKVRVDLRKKFGDDLAVVGLCSAAGDLAPRDLIRWVEPETPTGDPNINRKDPKERIADPSMFDIKGTQVVGRRIAGEIIAVYEEGLTLKDSAVLIHEKLDVDLPLRRVTIKDYHEAEEKISEFVKTSDHRANVDDMARLHIYAGTIARYELQQSVDIHTIEMHVARFGDVAFATNPFELFLNYGNQIRVRSKAKQTFLIQLACSSDGYLPTEKAEKGGHYSAYVSSGIVGHIGGEMLVRKTLAEINGMWSENE